MQLYSEHGKQNIFSEHELGKLLFVEEEKQVTSLTAVTEVFYNIFGQTNTSKEKLLFGHQNNKERTMP